MQSFLNINFSSKGLLIIDFRCTICTYECYGWLEPSSVPCNGSLPQRNMEEVNESDLDYVENDKHVKENEFHGGDKYALR